MKVKELIEFLSDVDPETQVIMAADQEGNSYSFIEPEEGHYKLSDGLPEAVHENDLGSDWDTDFYAAAIILWPSYGP